jgi:PAS domain S-box-containing protein
MISVLYVDDDPSLLEVTQLILERSGEFRVDLATSAEDALKVPALLIYDAVVSDYLMPDMDGIGLLKEIRSRSADIPFILFTGRGNEDVVIEAINNGADFYLRKGGDPTAQFAELKHKIKKAVERKRAKDALMESAEQYRLLAENSPEMIYIVDANGCVRYVNSVAARQFNAPPDAITGKHLSAIFPAPVAQQHLDVIRQVISSKKPIHRETQEETSAGALWTEVHLAPIIDQTGTVVAVLGLSNDITERRRTEEALRRNEARYRTLVESTSDIVWEVDKDGRYSYVSPVIRTVLGFEPAEVIGRTPFDLMPQGEAERIRTAFSECVDARRPIVRMENTNFHKDGHRVILETSGEPVFDTAGNLTGYRGIDRDITDRRRAEEALRETNKKLNLLSSITRHDVLNKLTALQGFIELSVECFSGDETFRSFADKELVVVSEVQRIISFTKEYEEIGVRSPEWQDVRDVLRKAAGWLDWSGVDLRFQVAGYMIYADPLLEKVFYNLLDNSLRHGRTVTSLQVSASETVNGLVIVCRDNGTGIPAGEKEKIFGRGYGRHSGFGLFLAREILGITGISIRETGQHGEGACFEILAPRSVYRAPG